MEHGDYGGDTYACINFIGYREVGITAPRQPWQSLKIEISGRRKLATVRRLTVEYRV